MPTPVNVEQSEYWNEVAGPRWVALQERLDAQLGALGRVMLGAAELAPGERVLDVGCGCGDTSLQAARQVEPGGSVLGLDLSEPMLARARERAAAAGVAGLRFERGDAQTHALPAGSLDAVISRFGVMFFADPEQAFAHLAEALVPGGRFAFVCWQAMDRNPWMAAPLAAVAQLVPLPPAPAPHAPGPFALADGDRVRALLAGAGLEAIEVGELRGELPVGGASSLEEAGEFLIEVGPAGRALREAGADEALRRRAASAAGEALRPWSRSAGILAPYAAWIVSARRPR